MGRISEAILALFGENKSSTLPQSTQSQALTVAATSATNVPVEQTGTQESLLHQPENDDCLSCKVVATGTLLGASSYVAYYAFKNRSKYSGRYKVAFYGQNLSLLTLLVLLSVSRAFDKGLFDKSRKNETLAEACENDFNYFIKKMGFKLPDFLKDSDQSSK